jgi:hypothetical protein
MNGGGDPVCPLARDVAVVNVSELDAFGPEVAKDTRDGAADSPETKNGHFQIRHKCRHYFRTPRDGMISSRRWPLRIDGYMLEQF